MKRFIGIVLTLMWVSSSLAAFPPKDEQKFREQFGLTNFQSVSYRNSDDKNVTFDQFYDLVAGDQSFSMKRDVAAGKATLAPLKQNFLIKRGGLMPEPRLRDLDEHSIELQARNQRPLLMNFFFAGCGPCIAEIPALNEFKRQRPDIDVVAVTFDSAAEARTFTAKHEFDWPVVATDGKEFNNKIGIKSYPSFALVGKDGKVLQIASSAAIPGLKDDSVAAKLDAWVRSLTGS